MMGCCDCGLVHEVQFKVRKVVQRKARGIVISDSVPNGAFIVHFRARRAEGWTRLQRKNKKYARR